MGRRRSAALVLACWLLAACTYTTVPAESSALACSNDDDDDGDLKKDCWDPDCWSFARCRVNVDASVPLPPFMPPPSGVPGPPDVFEPPVDEPDGHVPQMPPDAGVMTDGAMDAEADAEPPLLCSDLCPEGECTDGVCNVPLELGEYRVTGIDILVSREMSPGVCFDAPGNCDTFELLCCPPDPYVNVRIGDKKAGFVRAPNSALKTWNEVDIRMWNVPDIRMKLHEGDELTFEVVDDNNEAVGDRDNIGAAQPMFTCTTIVTLGKVFETRALGCTPDNEDRTAGALQYGVTATIERIESAAP
jgi:hypothetical protein